MLLTSPVYAPNQEVSDRRQKFYAALRSGKYLQGRSRLKTPEGEFCCLGVACEVSGYGSWEGGLYSGQQSVLPQAIVYFYGFSGRYAALLPFVPGGENTDAIQLNDSCGFDFPQIADAFERTYPAALAPTEEVAP